ncbi:MAG: NAD(P)/FAD-dependent oxidoreductase [Nitrospirae bacterium]|nr:NAD(P)/FAD-dependent oxidoreductase [Nitrospirota bacterium]
MKYLIIGNSIAGVSAARIIRRHDKDGDITIVTKEAYPFYSKCLLPYYLRNEVGFDETILADENFYKEKNIYLIKGRTVTKVLTDKNKLLLDNNQEILYDKLLIAAGASPIQIGNGPNIFSLRSFDDVERIKEAAARLKKAVVVGAGPMGMKVAYGLKGRLGCNVIVLEAGKQVFTRILSKRAAFILSKHLINKGIEIKTNSRFISYDGKHVKIDGASHIEADFVVMAIGVKPNIGFLNSSGITTNTGVIVDSYMRTNIDNIYAAGDAAEAFDPVTKRYTINATWPSAVLEGETAGCNMAGIETQIKGNVSSNSIQFFGLSFVSAGLLESDDQQIEEEIIDEDIPKNLFKRLVFLDNKLVGFEFLGDVQNAGIYLDILKEQKDISQFKNRLSYLDFDYGKVLKFAGTEERFFL